MPKFEIIASHPITFLFSIEASTQKEAIRIVMDNEHNPGQADQIDEGDRNIESVNKVKKFVWETGCQ